MDDVNTHVRIKNVTLDVTCCGACAYTFSFLSLFRLIPMSLFFQLTMHVGGMLVRETRNVSVDLGGLRAFKILY